MMQIKISLIIWFVMHKFSQMLQYGTRPTFTLKNNITKGSVLSHSAIISMTR